jgi:hypothetical protein
MEEIGRGGMGVVYKARELATDRLVALKILPSFAGLDPDAVARFRREAEAAGRVSHPGIVPIHAVGQTRDTYYFAMELVEGPSMYQLLENLKDTPPENLRGSLAEETALATVYPDLRESRVQSRLAGARYPASCAALALEVTDALSAAHRAGVIHRDMKPGNILLHPDGRAVIVDFGLARDELGLAMTRTGDAIGTPSYMAPEQAAGSTQVDVRVDVYGLGATLYEMVTLQPPFDGPHSADIMRQILEQDPIPVRKLNPRVPMDLETIVLKCLAKDPDHRYQDVDTLRDDLLAFMSGEPIKARRPGLGWQAARWMKRNRGPVYVGMLSLLFALFVGLTVGLVSLSRTRTSGRGALEDARRLLLEGRPMASHAAYGKALGLLKDPAAVSEARLRHLREVFDTLYAGGRFRVLQDFLDALPASESDRPDYHTFRTRLRGHGYLVLPRPQQDGDYTVWVRGLVRGELESRWRQLPLDGRLQVGQYLAKVVVPDALPIVQAVVIQRDQEVKLQQLLPLVDQLRAGMSLVAGKDLRHAFAVDTTEMTSEGYTTLLQSIQDAELREEMLPRDWGGATQSYMPVGGVSLRQARTAAALLGKHVLSGAEYLRAATGGLHDMRYPWGTRFDVNRVVGDPSYTSKPRTANSKKVGAAPCGAVHLVGNVAELLAPDAEGRIYAAGGHYVSRPEDLTVRSRKALADMDTQVPVNGFRLASFLAPPDEPEVANGLETRLQQLRSDLIPHAVDEWTLGNDGEVRLRQTVVPDPTDNSVRLKRPAGFRGWRATKVQDLHGRNLSWRFTKNARQPELVVPLAPRSPGRRGFRVEQQLLLRTALLGSGDVYRLRLPVANGPGVHFTRLTLPLGCRLEAVWPDPALNYHMDRRQHLVWERALEDAHLPTRTLLVQFRRDGALTTRLSAVAPAAAVVKSFLAAMGANNRGRLATMLTADFHYQRRCLDRDTFLRRVQTLPHYRDVHVEDVITVGGVVIVEMTATKHSRGEVAKERIPNWPLRVVLLRQADSLRVLQMMPRTRVDLGVLQDGVYRHAKMKVDLRPPAHVRIHRTTHALTELQVRCVPTDRGGRPDAWMTILGCYAGPNESEASIRDRLTTVSLAGQPGQRANGSRMDYVGPNSTRNLVGKSQHWLLLDPTTGGWIWERWTYLQQGSRYFLLRAVAQGADRHGARQHFRAYEPWFAAIAGALRIR